eukprot:scaffold52959_cov59-Phaeocystis_antarctica.AAC.1
MVEEATEVAATAAGSAAATAEVTVIAHIGEGFTSGATANFSCRNRTVSFPPESVDPWFVSVRTRAVAARGDWSPWPEVCITRADLDVLREAWGKPRVTPELPVAAAPGVGVFKREDEVDVVGTVHTISFLSVKWVADARGVARICQLVLALLVTASNLLPAPPPRICQEVMASHVTAHNLLSASDAGVVVLAVNAVRRGPFPVHGRRKHFIQRLLPCLCLFGLLFFGCQVDQQASTHRWPRHKILHCNPDVLCRNWHCKEGVEVAARARENCPSVHVAPHEIIGAVLDGECRHLFIVLNTRLTSNAKDRSGTPGVDLHPLPVLLDGCR